MSRYLIFISWYSLLLTINSYTYIVERQPSGDVIYGIDCIHYNAVKYGNGCKCSNNGTFYYDFYITQCIKGPGSYWLGMSISGHLCFTSMNCVIMNSLLNSKSHYNIKNVVKFVYLYNQIYISKCSFLFNIPFIINYLKYLIL